MVGEHVGQGHYIRLRAEANQPIPLGPPLFLNSVTTTGRPNKVKLGRGDEIRMERVKEGKCIDTAICMFGFICTIQQKQLTLKMFEIYG